MATTMAPAQGNRAQSSPQPQRQQRSQPQQAQGNGRASATNVSDTERLASVIGGGLLALLGLTRGSAAGLGLAALGAGLCKRGVTGHCEVYGALGLNTAQQAGAPVRIPA